MYQLGFRFLIQATSGPLLLHYPGFFKWRGSLTNENERTDVLVIGGGTAWIGVTIAATRQGSRVTLLEATSKIGDVIAFCSGMPWEGCKTS